MYSIAAIIVARGNTAKAPITPNPPIQQKYFPKKKNTIKGFKLQAEYVGKNISIFPELKRTRYCNLKIQIESAGMI